MNRLCFLSGLPRTGTTVLSSILNQNPNIHSTSTSGLLDFLVEIDKSYWKVSERYSSVDTKQLQNIFTAVSSSYYSHIKCKTIIDKWRGWIANIDQIKQIIDSNPKIISTYRPIEEIIVSFLHLLQEDENNFVDQFLLKNNIDINNQNRSNFLWKHGVVGETYEFFKQSLDPTNILYISYDQIVNNTNNTIKKIYNYLEIEYYTHDFKNISNCATDNDDYWKIKNLHLIDTKIQKKYKNPENYLSKQSIQYYKKFNNIFDYV